VKKGRDFFDILKSYYHLKKNTLVKDVNQGHQLYFYKTLSNNSSPEELKNDLENSKKRKKGLSKNFIFLIFASLNTFWLYQKYIQKRFLRTKYSYVFITTSFLAILGNVYLQTKINDEYKYKFKELLKEVDKKTN
jgi:hypothetical protein